MTLEDMCYLLRVSGPLSFDDLTFQVSTRRLGVSCYDKNIRGYVTSIDFSQLENYLRNNVFLISEDSVVVNVVWFLTNRLLHHSDVVVHQYKSDTVRVVTHNHVSGVLIKFVLFRDKICMLKTGNFDIVSGLNSLIKMIDLTRNAFCKSEFLLCCEYLSRVWDYSELHVNFQGHDIWYYMVCNTIYIEYFVNISSRQEIVLHDFDEIGADGYLYVVILLSEATAYLKDGRVESDCLFDTIVTYLKSRGIPYTSESVLAISSMLTDSGVRISDVKSLCIEEHGYE